VDIWEGPEKELHEETVFSSLSCGDVGVCVWWSVGDAKEVADEEADDDEGCVFKSKGLGFESGCKL
jgi:hypothetical protein